MPTKPQAKALTGNSEKIINAILNSNKAVFDGVPYATNSPESLKQIGAVIMNNPDMQNNFVRALVNRIGLVVINSELFYNPLTVLKKGILDFGETIEEIFVMMAQPYQYDPDYWEGKEFKRFLPDVKSAFHVVNYEVFYPVTVQQNDLRKAFLGWQGMEEFIRKLVEQVYTGANWDEYQCMLYLLGRQVLNGNIKVISVPTYTKDNIEETVIRVKGISNTLSTTMSTEYNFASVPVQTPKDKQVILTTAKFNATVDVSVLAAAFNMQLAEFYGRQIMVNNFGDLDIKRLNQLLGGHPDYVEFSAEEIELLKKIDCILMDEGYFMVFDYIRKFTEQYSGINDYWNYYYHVQSVMSTSPFKSVVAFAEAESDITAVKVTPNTLGMSAGTSQILNVEVTGNGFVSQRVTWTSDSDYADVDIAGMVTLHADAPEGTKIEIRATSVDDPTKFGIATITAGGSAAYTFTGATFVPDKIYMTTNSSYPARVVLNGTGNIPQSVVQFRFGGNGGPQGATINKFTGVISADNTYADGMSPDSIVECYDAANPSKVYDTADLVIYGKK